MQVKIYWKPTNGWKQGTIELINCHSYDEEVEDWHVCFHFIKKSHFFSIRGGNTDRRELQNTVDSVDDYYSWLRERIEKIEVDGVVFWSCHD